ncbi:tRNA(Ile)-lysidine synthase [Pseudorhizobium tarimense]|uniref:tRNA(Ile)-lysidine synthase n=1 Tax=Pseudorhizobium tarimense TaxID=1079109 RepID=A0ABV2H7X8_9HYPH|nr:tRNA lysidine(34) synthetase TilS [Pseudorhizobium tarimense]MCJ8519608.1 tRNA lysidine(34) synthetase TilS [Pseudorhizobium tarimense]
MTTADHSSLSPQEAIERLLKKMPSPCRLLVAVSGGSDSVGLLAALCQKTDPQVELVAATVDHRLRPESAAEAADVAALCARLGVPHHVLVWQGEKPKAGLPAAAREARYALLAKAAEEADADAILTGHTRDDQFETIAMRSARGGGADAPGLAGMAEAVLLQRRCWLLRPFLRTRRTYIRHYLTQRDFGWIDDPSNVDPRFERARIRNEAGGSQPERLEPLEAAATERTALSEAAADLLATHATVQHGVLMHLAPPALLNGSHALRYALAISAAVLGGREQALASQSVERVMAAVRDQQPFRLTAGRVIFDLRRGGLFLCRERRGLADAVVPAGQTLIWDGRYRITNAGTEAAKVGLEEEDRQQAAALFSDVSASVAMRARRALPHVAAVSGGSVKIEAMLAPYDRFLPLFDYKLAGVLGKLFGCDNFPPLPFRDCELKR